MNARFVYLCPSCSKQAASAWRILFLGPMASFRCPHCRTSLGISRGLAFAAVALETLAFLIGAVVAMWMIGSFSGFGALTLASIAGGAIASIPVAFWLLLSAKLVAR